MPKGTGITHFTVGFYPLARAYIIPYIGGSMRNTHNPYLEDGAPHVSDEEGE
jgi:hypothetical protein